MAHFRHIEDAQKGCSLLRSTAGVKDDEGLLGQDADAAAVLHSGKARQNGLIGDLKALAPEGQRQLNRDGGIARRAVELALALWRKGFEIPDEAILAGLAAVETPAPVQRPATRLEKRSAPST